ncbi:hypothetical protein P43SY_001793 [Pythium insidiosum]|uniref:DEAD/DEAH box RNA helicase n=1 Tax=Pythium insidiosum TaxID=114742 RepID=A0AAD5Q8M5_PYTIN|nr:hypothetical protein P43SY_001793 [Pythium insidiosum]
MLLRASSSKAAGASFEALGLHSRLVDALREMGIEKPSGIQTKSIPAILSRQDILCTAQTGTGKTLAYLVPIVEQLHRNEEAMKTAQKLAGVQDPAPPLPSRPEVLVLLPSRELALQVGDVTKRLAHSAKFASCTVTSGVPKSIQQRSLARRLDVVIGTPGRVAKCIDKGDFYLSRVNTVVLDEADTLLDAKMGFRNELEAVLKPIEASAAKRQMPLQVVLVAATIRSPLDRVVRNRFGDLKLVSDDQIHQTPTTLREEFVRTTSEQKLSALREALHGRQVRNARTVVFCRNAASCRATDHMLREHGFSSRCLHGEMPTAQREASVAEFQRADSDVNILVCTDLAARGLHFDGVKHVIMVDFPKSAVDYVHRAGRAGRAGEHGIVTSLVTRHDLPLARSIEEAKQQRRAVRDLRTDVASVVTPLDTRPPREERQPLKAAATKASPQSQSQSQRRRGTKRLRSHKLRVVTRPKP